MNFIDKFFISIYLLDEWLIISLSWLNVLHFFFLFVNKNYIFGYIFKFAFPMWRICRLWVTCLELRDRMRQSLPVSEFAQQREAKKEFAGRDKERRDGKEKGWNYLLVRREMLFGNIFGPGKHIAEQRLACARRKTHKKNRITTSALVRNIKNIWRGKAQSVEWKNKVRNALAPKDFIDASPFRNEIWQQPRIVKRPNVENQFQVSFLLIIIKCYILWNCYLYRVLCFIK